MKPFRSVYQFIPPSYQYGVAVLTDRALPSGDTSVVHKSYEGANDRRRSRSTEDEFELAINSMNGTFRATLSHTLSR